MSREIKFRAWSIIAESMNYINPKHPDGYGLSSIVPDKDWSVMQYTGLKDKNGTEIYEGDVLHIKFLDTDKKGAVLQVGSGAYSCAGYTVFGINYDCEVIGNIYQNTELLEPERKTLGETKHFGDDNE